MLGLAGYGWVSFQTTLLPGGGFVRHGALLSSPGTKT